MKPKFSDPELRDWISLTFCRNSNSSISLVPSNLLLNTGKLSGIEIIRKFPFFFPTSEFKKSVWCGGCFFFSRVFTHFLFQASFFYLTTRLDPTNEWWSRTFFFFFPGFLLISFFRHLFLSHYSFEPTTNEWFHKKNKKFPHRSWLNIRYTSEGKAEWKRR